MEQSSGIAAMGGGLLLIELALTVLPIIFYPILAFGSAEYRPVEG